MGAYITEITISHKRITHRIFYRRKKYPLGRARSCDRSQRQLPENVLLVCPQIPALGRFSRRDRHGGRTACNSNKHMNAPYGNNGRMNSKLQISVCLDFLWSWLKGLPPVFTHIIGLRKSISLCILAADFLLYIEAFSVLVLKTWIL